MSVNRRQFLAGLGASAAFLGPWASAARAAECFDRPGTPRRFVIVMQGNGIYPEHLLSAEATAAGTDPFSMSSISGLTPTDESILAPLQGGERGIDLTAHAAVIHGLSNTIAGGGHTSFHRATSCAKGPQETIDSWLARTLFDTAPFDAVRMSVAARPTTNLQYGMHLGPRGENLPLLANPTSAFAALFGSAGEGASARQFGTDRAILDFARDDVRASLATFSGSSRERQKLEAYLASIEQLRTEKQRLSGASSCLRDVVETEGLAPSDSFSHPGALVRLREQFKLATAALLGQMTQVVVIGNGVGDEFAYQQWPTLTPIFESDPNYDGNLPWRHGVAHLSVGVSDESPISRQTAERVIRRVNEVNLEETARLARALAAVPEGDGTMLDHTAILFMSDNGDHHHSQAKNWPMLLLGGSALGLTTGGRTLMVPRFGQAGHARVSNMMNTLTYAAGAPMDDWGGEVDKADFAGPLELLLRS